MRITLVIVTVSAVAIPANVRRPQPRVLIARTFPRSVPTSTSMYLVRLKLDMLFNNARPVGPGVPFFLASDSLTGLNQNNVDIHARQTTLEAALTGPEVGSLQSGGILAGMLFSNSIIDDRNGFLPLQAYGDLRNEDWRFAAGLQFDVFVPGMPTILPFSALAASGNAGNSFRGSLAVRTLSCVRRTMFNGPCKGRQRVDQDYRLRELLDESAMAGVL